MYKINLGGGAAHNLLKFYINTAFNYQREWVMQAFPGRTRHLTKSRQSGADWLFSLEALLDALNSGRNQVFLADDEGLLNISHAYFKALLSLDGFECSAPVEIEGKSTVYSLPNGSRILFLMSDSLMTSISGNVYLPEYAWAKSPMNLMKLAKGLACHKQHRLTYYTTPSRSFSAWQVYKKITSKPDVWNGSITIEDLLHSDCTLYSEGLAEALRQSMNADDFALLYQCQWQPVVA